MVSRCTRERPCDRHGYEYWADEDGEHKGKCLRPEVCAEYESIVERNLLEAHKTQHWVVHDIDGSEIGRFTDSDEAQMCVRVETEQGRGSNQIVFVWDSYEAWRKNRDVVLREHALGKLSVEERRVLGIMG